LRHILSFYRYNSDIRKKYLTAIGELAWEEVIKDRGASFHSIRNVFLHVLDAYRYWFDYGLRDSLKEYRRADRDSFRNIDDMRTYEHEVDSMVVAYVENLREEALAKIYVIHDEDGTWTGTLETILMHMIEEELQHRGDINCMFWQQDIDPPITEYGRWLKQTEMKV
jgi:uncharacterized damage-inducible protein DinB